MLLYCVLVSVIPTRCSSVWRHYSRIVSCLRGTGWRGWCRLFATYVAGRIGSQVSCHHASRVVTARQRSCGKIMFSVVCVRHSVHGGGGGLCTGPQPSRTSSNLFNLDLTVQPTPTYLNLCTLNGRLSASWHSTEMPSCYDSGQWSFYSLAEI